MAWSETAAAVYDERRRNRRPGYELKHDHELTAKKKCYANPLKRSKEPMLHRMNGQRSVRLNAKKCILLSADDPAVDRKEDTKRDTQHKADPEKPKKGLYDGLSSLGLGMAKEEGSNDYQTENGYAQSRIFDPRGNRFPEHEDIPSS